MKEIMHGNLDKELTCAYTQWAFRFIRNDFYVLSFFPNDGTLSSDEILRQYLYVLLRLSARGITVVGNLGDAASNITGMLKLTRLKSQMGMYEINPSTKEVCSVHPYMLNGSQISTNTCSVHVAKRTRTQLYLSQPHLSKNFVHGGIPFGWDTVKLIYHYVHSIGRVVETKLCDNAVHPTGRTAMNVGYMKAIFDPKTICFGLQYIRETFLTDQGREDVEDLSINQFQLNIDMNGMQKKVGGYALLVETYERTIFSSTKNYKENRVDRSLVHELKTFIKGLIYMAHFCDLYSELYLNSSMFITRENIDILDNFVKNGVMSYLLKWRREIDDEKGQLETEYAKKMNSVQYKAIT